MNKFKKLKIPIPTINEQKIIISNIDELNNENKRLEEQIKKNIQKSKKIISEFIIKK